MTEWVTALADWGSVGATIIVVVIFLAHLKTRDDLMMQAHLACEQRIENLANKALESIEKNTQELTSLKNQVQHMEMKI